MKKRESESGKQCKAGPNLQKTTVSRLLRLRLFSFVASGSPWTFSEPGKRAMLTLAVSAACCCSHAPKRTSWKSRPCDKPVSRVLRSEQPGHLNVHDTQFCQENTTGAPETETPRQTSYIRCSAGVSPKRFVALVSWAPRQRVFLIAYTIFSGRTVSSNSSAVRSPRARTASFNVVPSWRAFLAHLAAAS